jgi:hypothetical protein
VLEARFRRDVCVDKSEPLASLKDPVEEAQPAVENVPEGHRPEGGAPEVATQPEVEMVPKDGNHIASRV